jgi:hypothetical protein
LVERIGIKNNAAVKKPTLHSTLTLVENGTNLF